MVYLNMHCTCVMKVEVPLTYGTSKCYFLISRIHFNWPKFFVLRMLIMPVEVYRSGGVKSVRTKTTRNETTLISLGVFLSVILFANIFLLFVHICFNGRLYSFLEFIIPFLV